MSAEKAAGNQPSNSGGTNKGPSKSSRRRPLRSKRRGRKPEEGGEPRSEHRNETRNESRNESRSEGRGEVRSESREPRAPSTNKSVDKSVRDNRDRRRRRRMRAKQRGASETQAPVVEDILKDLPPLVPAFVYTHVLRPAMRDSFEFRTEHFSKVTRRMEDFHIDLSPLYPDGGDEIKGVAYMPPLAERAGMDDEFDDGDYNEDDDEAGDKATGESGISGELEALDNPDWDAEEIEDAAALDGAASGIIAATIADEFYEDLGDSVVDEYPEEDLDD